MTKTLGPKEWDANEAFASLDSSSYSPPKSQPNTVLHSPSPAPYMQSVIDQRLVASRRGNREPFGTIPPSTTSNYSRTIIKAINTAPQPAPHVNLEAFQQKLVESRSKTGESFGRIPPSTTSSYSHALQALDLDTGSFRTTPLAESQLNLGRLESTLFPISPRNILRQDTALKSSSHSNTNYLRTLPATPKVKEPSQPTIVMTAPRLHQPLSKEDELSLDEFAKSMEIMEILGPFRTGSFRTTLVKSREQLVRDNEKLLQQFIDPRLHQQLSKEDERSLAELPKRMNTREETGERSHSSLIQPPLYPNLNYLPAPSEPFPIYPNPNAIDASILPPPPPPPLQPPITAENPLSIKEPSSSSGVSLALPSLGATPIVAPIKSQIKPSESSESHRQSNALTYEVPPLVWDALSPPDKTAPKNAESQSSSSEARQTSAEREVLMQLISPNNSSSSSVAPTLFGQTPNSNPVQAQNSDPLVVARTANQASIPDPVALQKITVEAINLLHPQDLTTNTLRADFVNLQEALSSNVQGGISDALTIVKKSISRHSNSGTPSAVNAQQVSFSANKASQNSAIPNAVVSSVAQRDSIKNENASPLTLELEASLSDQVSIMESSSTESPLEKESTLVNANSASNRAKPENPSIQPNVVTKTEINPTDTSNTADPKSNQPNATTTESPSTHVKKETEIKSNETSSEPNQLNDTAAVLETNPIKTPSKTRQPLRFLSSLLTSILTSLISHIISKLYNFASRNSEQNKQPQGSRILQNEDLKTIENKKRDGEQGKDLKTERDPDLTINNQDKDINPETKRDPDLKTEEAKKTSTDLESAKGENPNTVIQPRGTVTKLEEGNIGRTP